MELPPRAASLYGTWWSFVSFAAHQRAGDGTFAYQLTDVSSAAADIARTVGGRYAPIDVVGISQLFSRARTIAKASAALDGADASAALDATMVAEAPWSRPLAGQLASPAWQGQVLATYTNPVGEVVQEWFTVGIPLTLPSSVGDLRTGVTGSLDAMLTAPPTRGTPRKGQLISVDQINLLSV